MVFIVLSAVPHGSVASLVALVVKSLLANAGDLRDMSSVPGSGKSSGGGHGNPLQYSCLENSMDRGAWWAISPWVCKESDTTEVTWHARKCMHKFPILCCQMGWNTGDQTFRFFFFEGRHVVKPLWNAGSWDILSQITQLVEHGLFFCLKFYFFWNGLPRDYLRKRVKNGGF